MSKQVQLEHKRWNFCKNLTCSLGHNSVIKSMSCVLFPYVRRLEPGELILAQKRYEKIKIRWNFNNFDGWPLQSLNCLNIRGLLPSLNSISVNNINTSFDILLIYSLCGILVGHNPIIT